MFGTSAFAEAPFASLAGGIVPAGDVASGFVGSVEVTYTVALTGVFGLGLAGTVGASPAIGLSGVNASGYVNTFVPIYWKMIDDSQNADWQLLNSASSAGWNDVDTDVATGWQLVDTTYP